LRNFHDSVHHLDFGYLDDPFNVVYSNPGYFNNPLHILWL